ncbi:DUF1178 family protein [Aurantimonas sp. HBX-1]|uniref:DUF1178 family protein n=1 Tax=Aurantimonas sp. HBX-1 TaxID=2906072 RepID=UPI001F3641B6|nr:DUF1178 family protein [Aurantimonas sp. HBX-1]UIJ72458.1 DUF1178 family protein [Aurantimonas sp. HBX-1]
MISFALRCEPRGHGFDGWFRSGEDFEAQAGRGLVECPACGSTEIGKALMRPAIGKGGAPAAAGERTAPAATAPGGGYANAEAARVFAKLQEMARELRAKADYVGPRFAEEARRIHYGETEARQIYGEASPAEVKGLSEEGIAALPLPSLPEDKN